MTPCLRAPLRSCSALMAVAIVFLGVLFHAEEVRAQEDLVGIRAEMDASNLRLGEMGMGLFRVTMQVPDLQGHVSLVTAFIQNVQTDLDYLEALVQLFELSGDRNAAAAVVLYELEGATERMQLGAFEEHVMAEESSPSEPRSMHAVEQALLTELRLVIQLYSRTTDLLAPAGR